MKTIAAFALGLGMLAWVVLAQAQEKKGEAPKLEGKYTLVSGKVNGTAVGDDAKKSEFTFTAEKVTIKGMDLTFVMSYKLDPKTDPVSVDMEILEGPEGRRSKAPDRRDERRRAETGLLAGQGKAAEGLQGREGLPVRIQEGQVNE